MLTPLYIVDSLPSAVTLQELLLACECNPTLKTIKEALDTGKWSATPKPFADLKDELCQKCGIMLWNNRIVIPGALHPHTTAIKASLRLNSLVAWHRYSSWEICMRMLWLPNHGPHTSSRAPPNDRSTKQVWHTVHVDYCGPFPSTEYLFVAVDETSKYPEVHVTHSSSAATTITHLTQMFATHGIPEVITSDNVPFGSAEFTTWCKQLGIAKLRPCGPLQMPKWNSSTKPWRRPFALLWKKGRTGILNCLCS